MASKKKTPHKVEETVDLGMQAPQEEQKKLFDEFMRMGQDSPIMAYKPDLDAEFEREYAHLSTQVPQLLKAILRELYMIRRSR